MSYNVTQNELGGASDRVVRVGPGWVRHPFRRDPGILGMDMLNGSG